MSANSKSASGSGFGSDPAAAREGRDRRSVPVEDQQVPSRRRRHKAAGARVAVTGMSVGALLGVVGAIGASSMPSASKTRRVASPATTPRRVPARAATTPTTIVWRVVHRVVVVTDPPVAAVTTRWRDELVASVVLVVTVLRASRVGRPFATGAGPGRGRPCTRSASPAARTGAAADMLRDQVPVTATEPTVTRQFTAMGSTAELVIVGNTGAELSDWAIARIEQLEALWSRFRPESELNRICRLAGAGPVPASAETLEVIGHAVALWYVTDGRFDPTIRSALEACGYDQTFRLVAPNGPPAPRDAFGSRMRRRAHRSRARHRRAARGHTTRPRRHRQRPRGRSRRDRPRRTGRGRCLRRARRRRTCRRARGRRSRVVDPNRGSTRRIAHDGHESARRPSASSRAQRGSGDGDAATPSCTT